MVHLISGAINSGKSSILIELFNTQVRSSGGFVSEKTNDCTNRFNYTLRNLITNEKMPLAMDQSDFKGEFTEIYAFDRFNFNRHAFDYGNALLIELASNPRIQNIFIDEIGIIELSDHGFSPGFRAVLLSQKNVYVCVRDKWLERIVAHFHLFPNYDIWDGDSFS